MSSPPPTKPPRGVKQGKETSGLLMSVIRTLSASETNEQREKEKAKLEREYKKSDQRLDELVSAHSTEITQVMQIFSSAYAAVNTCRTRLRATRARLTACRSLLRVRRDDLRRLWADARKHKYALDMLIDIDQLVAVDKEVGEHLARGHYLNAATVLQSALVLANTDLSQVDALQHLRMDLETKKQTLVERTSSALAEAVYRADIATGLRRQGSSRDRTEANMLALIMGELTKNEKLSDASLQDVNPEFELSLTEEEKTFKIKLAILIQSLAVLNQVKEATEKLKVQIQTELLQVIAMVSQQVIDYGAIQLTVINGPIAEYPASEAECSIELEEQNLDPQFQLLIELLTSLLESYRLVAQRQKLMLDIWKQTLVKHKLENVQLYTMQHYWNSVQSVLQLLLTDYLDIQNLTLTAQRTTFTEPVASSDITSFFSKKKQQSKKKVRLYKFSQSCEAESKAQNVTQSMEALSSRGKTYQLVCRPNPENLPYIYPILESFMNEIETNTGNRECSLRAFITDHIRNAEVERLSSVTKLAIDTAMKEPGAWREVGPPPKSGHCPSQNIMIFTCCWQSWSACERVCWWARRLGAGGSDALRGALAGCSALLTHARAAHAHVAPPARASRWLADDDIVRFLKALPNWRALKSPPKKKQSHSDQDIKQSYEREAEILGSSLGDGIVSHKEIISNNNTLREIAVMCETMDWLSNGIKAIPSSLITPSGATIKLPERVLNEISSTAALFEEISDNCLLLLHLELRIQCFHYLGQEDTSTHSLDFGSSSGDGSGDLTSESGAARLATSIVTFYEDAQPILQAAKLNYIIGGIGEMMSAGVVWRCRGDTRGASTQSARLATLRHCLAALGLPSHGLHRAAHYLDLLTMCPEEILNMVKEKGPQFTELEYLNAFNIIGKSKRLSEGEMKMYLNKLSNILGNVGVTV